jgi:hypothetical protein
MIYLRNLNVKQFEKWANCWIYSKH